MDNFSTVIRDVAEPDGGLLCPNIYGENGQLLRDARLAGNKKYGIAPLPPETVDAIFCNAIPCMSMFAAPREHQNTRKILAVGKVQSGKTAFFLSCVAYAFDSGYQLCCLIGGTKDPLRQQNLLRTRAEFENNPRVKVLEFNRENAAIVRKYLEANYFVILVVLKNASSENKNIGALKQTLEKLTDIETLVIDDEGDEYSPGAPKSKTGDTKTHQQIAQLIYLPKTCTYLSVTATPQANFLISTPDPLSPDSCVLVQPGKGYVGGVDFHDSMKNPHTEIIEDSDDFVNCIPESFDKALRTFVLSCCIKLSRGETRGFSMLVNPSSLQTVHSSIVNKILSRIRDYKISMRPEDPSFGSEKNDLKAIFDEYLRVNPDRDDDFEKVISYLPEVLNTLSAYEYNSSSSGKEDRLRADNDGTRYKIYVGGGMLGRGLTINRLIVTYIYNDSKKTYIDTLYQRARWLGYKSSYFDVCKVFLTFNLQQKFIDTVNSETDMWTSLGSFLAAKINVKKWPRFFTLNNESLRLTRTTVSKTVVVDRVNPGYTYDKTIALSMTDRRENRELALSYLHSHSAEGKEIDFSNNGSQIAFVFQTSITELCAKFMSAYKTPRGSTFGPLVFGTLKSKAENGDIPDEIDVLFLRYKTGEFRNGISDDNAIGELPQGRNDGTGFFGDRNLPGFSDRLHLQIHMVYSKKGESKDDAFPILALNNPISMRMIQYVTGDNVYE